MRHFDLSPLYKTSIGFDRFASLFDSLSSLDNESTGYPPYNIELLGENSYRITMAIAGFGEDDINVEVKENVLTIRGEKSTENGDKTYLHRGIASRTFERRFQLADHVEVRGATLEHGMLHLDMVREVPEAMKPRTIKITNGDGAGARTIEDKAA